MSKISPNAPCPCYSGSKYKKCCRPYHDGTPAPTPEALMRSRYSAYALGNTAHIMRTTHPDSPHWRANATAWKASLDAFSVNTEFAGLEILATDETTVTFQATLFQNGQDASYTERSLFAQVDGRWLYIAAHP